MISNYGSLPDLVIPSGQTVSQVFNSVFVYSDAVAIMIESPEVLPESVYIEVNPDQEATNSSTNWTPYETFDPTGASINLYVPSAGKSQVYQEPVFAGSFRLTSTGPVGSNRAFKCNKIWTT